MGTHIKLGWFQNSLGLFQEDPLLEIRKTEMATNFSAFLVTPSRQVAPRRFFFFGNKQLQKLSLVAQWSQFLAALAAFQH